MGVGIYAEEENKFFFNNVIVGRTAKARFKLTNINKVKLIRSQLSMFYFIF